MSKKETMLCDFISDRLQIKKKNSHIIRNWHPKWLNNKRTGRNFEIDIYIGKFKTGFEYQSDLHFKDICVFRNNSDNIRYNDSAKQELSRLSERIVNIIEIFEPDLNKDIYNNVLKRIINTRDLYIKRMMNSEDTELKISYKKKAKYIEYLRLFYVNNLKLSSYEIVIKKNYLICKHETDRPILKLDYKYLYSIDEKYDYSAQKNRQNNLINDNKPSPPRGGLFYIGLYNGA